MQKDESKQNKKLSFFEVSKIMLQNCKKSYIFYFVLMLFSVFFAIFGTYSTKVLIDILQNEATPSTLANLDILERGFIYMFGGIDFLTSNIWFFAIIILGFALLSGGIIVVRRILQANFQSRMSENLQSLLFYHIERLPYSKIKSMKNGDIIQTCTTDAKNIRIFLSNNLALIIYTSLIVLFSFIILVISSWKIALTAMSLMPIMFIYSFFIIKKVRQRYRSTDDSEGLMTAKIEENLSSVRLVKAYNNEAFEIKDFDKYINDYKHKYMSWRKLSSFFYSSSDIFVFGEIALTSLIGFHLCFINEITVGTFVISFMFVNQMVWPIRDVATILSNMARARASLDRVSDIINEPLEDIDTGITPSIKGNIEFKNVSFKFDDSDKNTLNNLSFKINEGETVAIMGKTGSGKSTLAYLLTRLYDSSEGHIYLDGTDIKKIKKGFLRKNVNIVLQEPFLFSKTIKDNLKISRQDAEKNELIRASQIAHIHENILKFKDGYDTPVGEKGTTLSGGQKQRVSIARTLLNKSKILIFDDSLSAVDTETDYNIRRSLKEREDDSTTLIITHRIATAKDASKIIVLENGTISQMGTHQELIKQEGLYKRIYEIQTKMV